MKWLFSRKIIKTEKLLPSFTFNLCPKSSTLATKFSLYFFKTRNNIFSENLQRFYFSLLDLWTHTKKAGFEFKHLDFWLWLILVGIFYSSRIFSSQNTNWNNTPNVTPVICSGLGSAEISASSAACRGEISFPPCLWSLGRSVLSISAPERIKTQLSHSWDNSVSTVFRFLHRVQGFQKMWKFSLHVLKFRFVRRAGERGSQRCR